MATAIFALVICLGCAWAGWGYVALAHRMTSFKSTSGKVIAREVVPIPTGDTRTSAVGDGGGYMPRVVYRYAVNGADFESDKIQFAIEGWKHEVAEQKLAAIPDDVTVWYDPDSPKTAYLVRHTPGVGYLLLALGIFGACCVLIWIGTRVFG